MRAIDLAPVRGSDRARGPADERQRAQSDSRPVQMRGLGMVYRSRHYWAAERG